MRRILRGRIVDGVFEPDEEIDLGDAYEDRAALDLRTSVPTAPPLPAVRPPLAGRPPA